MSHFFLVLCHASGVHSLCLKPSLKICLTISFVSSSHALMSSVLIPLLSAYFAFFWVCNSSVVISRVSFISLVSVPRSFMLFSVSFLSYSSSVLSYWPSSYNLLSISPTTLAIPFLYVLTSPLSFFILVKSILLFADFMPGMISIPLKSSSILWFVLAFLFFCLWCIFLFVCSNLSIVVSHLWKCFFFLQ